MKQFPLLLLFAFLLSLILVNACGGRAPSSADPTESSETAVTTETTATATQNSEQDSERGESRNANVQLTTLEKRYQVVADNCTERGPVMFTHSPIKIEDIKNLTPYGQVVGGHLTPIDHMYIEPRDVSLGRDVYFKMH